MKSHKKRKLNKQVILLKAHRYIGLTSFIILCWLAISGLLLNYTEGLQLNHKKSTNKLLLNLYNIPTPTFTKGIKVGEKWLFGIDDNIYFNKLKLSANYTPPFITATFKDDFLFVATKNELLIFTFKGDYVDKLSSKADIKKIGLNNSKQVVIQTADACLFVDSEFTQLSPCQQKNQIAWLQPQTIPKALKDELLRQYQGAGISWERVFLDAHSGRILGIAGVYFMDAMAILIIILGLSGFLIWLFRSIKKRKK